MFTSVQVRGLGQSSVLEQLPTFRCAALSSALQRLPTPAGVCFLLCILLSSHQEAKHL